ncbi:MAG: Re/Si-specific NAD(P)(+) transhydrogenase subunit alpha [Proteobacteria bacterium]|nr:Re/Si-specific NAD(P)(+) transhydrogenase subunit alpha [Pseudomonadota bacterium]
MTRLAVLKERIPEEKRVAAIPENVAKYKELGFTVTVEAGAGEGSGHSDDAYREAGAEIESDRRALLQNASIVIKVNPPSETEIGLLARGTTLISLIYPKRNESLVRILAAKGVNTLSLDSVPRITRAQKMDVLSSMSNLVGYRAVLEASTTYNGFFSAQVTAAGTLPPAKVLIIGAGVAGLAAIGAARGLGADVRAFDTRAAAREQVESLGARFLEVEIEESGEGTGGYAKVMSKEFIEAEMALFLEQAKECDVIVTTALVPGAKAPTLLKREHVTAMKRGSVVVDLAAEQGGNCELTSPGRLTEANGVKIIGYTDLPSRMASTSSRFFGTNIVHLLSDMSRGDEGFRIDLEDEVVRGATVVHDGQVLPPPPPKPATDVAEPKPKPRSQPPPEAAKPEQEHIMRQRAWGTTVGGLVLIALFFVVGRFAPDAFLQHLTVFILACFVGWQVIWSVTPALHTPLMSVTNAISGIIIIGGMLQAGLGGQGLPQILGAVAILVASINIFGGFFVTRRMLEMFRKD